ncbi:hypothetical protein [Okeania sp. KiyG1]|uniref:hypothetical protein n=1 Tax=Okeania sp. KiyG1 TaxID=2720165 RepID=UPI001922B630|nr:hypothetical protein [Okeania sp. KiyG1]GGA23613.1 hypothetical protein CYANOKiyG1_38900 [Okeania sp. KiyG1]
MVSSKLIQLENSIQNLSLEEKLWLLEKIVQQVQEVTQYTNLQQEQKLVDIEYENQAKPIWEITVEIGKKSPIKNGKKYQQTSKKTLIFIKV